MAKHRDAQVNIIIGKNGTGKSTFAHNLIQVMKQKCLAITYNGVPKIWRQYPIVDVSKRQELQDFNGIKQVHFAMHEKAMYGHIYRNFREGIILFDDARGYIPSNITNPDNQTIYLKRLLMDFRHKMLDIIFVVHSPKDVPPNVWGFASNVFIGATDAMFDKSVMKTFSADEIIKAQEAVKLDFLKAKDKNNNSHYGLFRRVRVG